MKKVIVIGSCGAGKSTFSRQLGNITKLPVHHLDALYWRPGWEPTPKEEWRQKQLELMQQEEWIIDGNYGGTLELRLEQAETIIFFDFSRWLTTYRVIKRSLMYRGKTRPDLTAGCPERLDYEFIKFVWNFRRDSRPRILEQLEKHASKSNKKIIIFRHTADVEQYLAELQGKGIGTFLPTDKGDVHK